MKKLFMAAAALTIAMAMAPSFVGESLAASSKAKASRTASGMGPGSSYCNLGKNQRNTPSWNEHYGCLKTPARQAAARPAPTTTGAGSARASQSTYCGLARNARNLSSWNEYYGCLH